MTPLFIIRLVTSFVVGGLFISLQTLIAERVPIRWRGIILTIPSTSALGFLFIALTKSPADVPPAAIIFPAALGSCYVFVALFAFLSRYNIWISMIGSYAAWAVMAALMLSYPPTSFMSSIFIYCLPLVIVCFALVKKLSQNTILVPVPFNLKHLLVRAFIGGSIMALVVLLAKTMGNSWGGFFSAFPAAFSATFLIYYLVHGKQCIPAVAKTIFFPGVIGFIIYAYVVGQTFPRWGAWYGTLIAYAVVLLFYWLYSKIKLKILKPSP